LEEQKLPYHKPKAVWFYDKNFWGRKSKAPYRWTGKKWFGCVPWVQFVGYQVRYDGLVRIKKDSFNKHLLRPRETTDKVKFGLLRWSRTFPKPYDPPSILAKKEQAILSLR
jgi:hypothetical protein